MELDQAVTNLQKNVNPNHGEMPVDQLNRIIRNIQFQNVRSQQQGIEATKQQLANMPQGADQSGLKNPVLWGALADMFAPEGQQTNFAGMAQHLKKDSPAQDAFKLQQQLARQEKNLADAAGDLVGGAGGSDLADKKEFARYQNELLRGRDKDKFANAKELARLRRSRGGGAGSSAGTGPGIGKLTVGDEAVDKKFAKDYSSWVSGGFSNVQGNLEKLREAQKIIEDPDTEVGGVLLPEFVRKRTNPTSVEVEQSVGNVVFQSLKEVLGGQFTEKEGQKLVEQTYDPALPDKINARKVKAAYAKIQRMAASKQEAVDYFSKNGTLKGFKGKNYNSIDQYMREVKTDVLGDTDKDDDALFNEIVGGE